MISRRAEANFLEGVQLLKSGRFSQALSPLAAAIESERLEYGKCHDARYLSYYGLGLCMSRTDSREALSRCRSAARLKHNDATIVGNLGRVALALGRRSYGYRALRHAHRLAPHDAVIARDLERLGKRRLPVLSFLPRAHPINVVLGRMRASLTPKRTPQAS